MTTPENNRQPLGRDQTPPELTSYDDIADTAILAAGLRGLTGIPYAQELYDAAVVLFPETAYPSSRIAEMQQHAPDLEVRDLITRQLIREAGNTQVLDVASGLSTL